MVIGRFFRMELINNYQLNSTTPRRLGRLEGGITADSENFEVFSNCLEFKEVF